MRGNSERVIESVLKLIQDRLWEGVAVENLKRLALHSSRLQGLQVLHSHIANQLQNRERKGQLIKDVDPKAITLDSLAVGFMQTEHNTESIPKPQRKQSFVSTGMRARTRKFTSESIFPRKLTEHRIAELQGEKATIIALPQDQDQHFVVDEQEDTLRVNKFKSEKYDSQMKDMVDRRSKEREESTQQNKKMFKDVKKFTFDYGGKFFTVGNMDLAPEKPAKLNKNDGKQNVVKTSLKNPQNSTIQNEKLNKTKRVPNGDTDIPNFDDKRPESLLDMVKNEQDISEGVKFIASKGAQKMIKQRKRKALSGIKKYRLSEFQVLPQESKFKQYRSKALNSLSSAALDVNKTASLPMHQNPDTDSHPIAPRQRIKSQYDKQTNSQSQQVLKVDKGKLQPYMILPPLKHNLLTRSRPSYSNRTIDISQAASRVTHKSKISIDHQELFEANFMERDFS